MRPRRQCFVRDEDGRIIGLRSPGDEFLSTAWMRDPGVVAFFRAKDRAYRLARGETEEDLDYEEAQAARALERRMGRLGR